MKFLFGCLIALSLAMPADGAESLSAQQAVALAEEFVATNGYTNEPTAVLKMTLDEEGLELAGDRQQQLAQRFNTLMPIAIGVRKEHSDRWLVAFDYVAGRGNPSACRLVSMSIDGQNMRLEHQDGNKEYFSLAK